MILFNAKQVKKKKYCTCKDCGRPIAPNEYATELSHYDSGTVITEYSCCTMPWNLNPMEPKNVFKYYGDC